MGAHWIDRFQGRIPRKDYQACVENGEEHGLIITLFSKEYDVRLDFGIVEGIQMLDEGVLLNNDDGEWSDIGKLTEQNFPSTIYEIRGGSFGNYIAQSMGCDFFHSMEMKQYNIITLNYVISIVAQYEPEITVLPGGSM